MDNQSWKGQRQGNPKGLCKRKKLNIYLGYHQDEAASKALCHYVQHPNSYKKVTDLIWTICSTLAGRGKLHFMWWFHWRVQLESSFPKKNHSTAFGRRAEWKLVNYIRDYNPVIFYSTIQGYFSPLLNGHILLYFLSF